MTEKGSSTAYIGIGSNLDNPLAQVNRALQALSRIKGCQLIRHSGLYRSPAMGPGEQPDYINAAAKLATSLIPHDLLTQLQAIENCQGRVRLERWGPRTLDLDLLLFDDLQLDRPDLTLPHPGLEQRAFVLLPLMEIEPDLQIPGSATVSRLLANCPAAGIVRLSSGDRLGSTG